MKWLARPLEATVALILAVLSCLVFLNVVLRYGFNTSISMTDEVSRYLFVWLTFIGAILACAERLHVDVAVLVEKLPFKGRCIMGLLTHAVMVFCCALMLVGSWQNAVQNWSDLEPISGIPKGVMYAACIPASIGIGSILIWRMFGFFSGLMGKTVLPVEGETS